MQKFNFSVDSTMRNGAPNYRFFKLVFSAALRLKLALPVDGVLTLSGEGEDTGAPAYKGRSNFKGKLSIGKDVFNDIIFVVDQSTPKDELVTFWKATQRGDSGGSKGGAHPFAEAYIGYLMGKTNERQSFPPSAVIKISDEYNSDPKFNITSWIITSAQAQKVEPENSKIPLEEPTHDPLPSEFPPELILLNKWQTDVQGTGVPYTNYEVDACIRGLDWGNYERIVCDVHWEDGKFVSVADFGVNDKYASKANREKVFAYLRKYDGTASRVRLILTVKGNADQWTIASATMLKRLKQLQQ